MLLNLLSLKRGSSLCWLAYAITVNHIGSLQWKQVLQLENWICKLVHVSDLLIKLWIFVEDIENQSTGISFPMVVVAVFFNHFDDNIDIDESDVTDVNSNSTYLLF